MNRIEFKPIREHYRKVILPLLPKYASVRIDAQRATLQIDFSFVDKVRRAIPVKYWHDMNCRVDQVTDRLAVMLPRMEELSGFFTSNIAISERLADGYLVRYDEERSEKGLMSFHDLLKHAFGISPCYLPLSNIAVYLVTQPRRAPNARHSNASR